MPEQHTKAACLYDALHRSMGKDYARESELVLDLIRSRVADATSLLDVACGTGRHLEHLSSLLDCEGLDSDETMLAVARGRCPGVPLTQHDMRDFDLGKQFDVVICLFSAIGYAITTDGLNRAIASMAKHIRPSGLLIVEPWFQPEQWYEGFLSFESADLPDIKIARMNRSRRRGDVAVMNFHYLVGTVEGIETFEEHHELGLFTWDQYRNSFEQAGLSIEIDKEGLTGRGLLLGGVES